jgi:hypothetical protein
MELEILSHLATVFETGEHVDSLVRLLSNGNTLRVMMVHRLVLARSPFFAVQLRWGGTGSRMISPQSSPMGALELQSNSARATQHGFGSPTVPRGSTRPPCATVMTEFDLDVGAGEEETSNLPWTMTKGDTSVARRSASPRVRAAAVEDAVRFLCACLREHG